MRPTPTDYHDLDVTTDRNVKIVESLTKGFTFAKHRTESEEFRLSPNSLFKVMYLIEEK
jgi:hypothetical protein